MAEHEPVRWALAGFGAGGRVFHAPMVRSCPGTDLVAVVSSNPQRGAEARGLGLHAVGSLGDLVDLGVEGVTITTPAGTHVELAHEALDLGLHVLVDKPFALDASRARAVVDHAREAGRTLSVYQNRRWDGDFLTVKALLASGELGTVRRFWSRIERFRPVLPGWTTQSTSAEGGGTLVDLGPHLIDQAVELFGPVASVFAELSTFSASAAAEDDIVLSLTHRSGARSTIVASLAAAAEAPRFQVNGDRGGVVIEGFDVQEEQLFAGGSPESLDDEWGVEPGARTATVVVDRQVSRRRLERGRWDLFYPALAAAIRGQGEVPVDPEDAVHCCQVFDAARRSSAEGRVIQLDG